MSEYLHEYLIVASFAVVAFCFVALVLGVAAVVRPKKESPVKLEPYECGMVPFGGAWSQFNVRFYVFALLFLIFDVEIAFLYPWATIFRSLGMTSLIEMLVFIFVLLLGLVYAWKKGVLKWV